MKIAFNPSTVEALIAPPNNKDITFDLRGHNIFARGVKFCGTDTNTWRDIKINNVSIDSNILDLRDGDNTTLTNINGVVTINSTWRPVVDNLTSDSTTSSLSANQGRILAELINGKSDSGHTHDDRYVKKSGDTMLGALNFANGTWNLVGDDSYMGDCNISGHFGIKAANTTYPGIAFFNNSGTHLGNLTAYSGNIKYGAYSLQFLDNGSTSVSASTWMNPFSNYDSNAVADGQAICVWGQASYLSNLANDTGDMSLWLKRVNANVATLNMVLDGEYYANGNQRLAHVSEIPNSLRNPYALTISLNGTSQGPYDGSAAKNINITPSSIGAATSDHNHINYLSANGQISGNIDNIWTHGTYGFGNRSNYTGTLPGNSNYGGFLVLNPSATTIGTYYTTQIALLPGYFGYRIYDDHKWYDWKEVSMVGHNHDGRYVRYYAVTTLDCNNLAVGLTAAGVSATNAAHTNHSAYLYISDVGTPFQIQIPDSSVPYIYKRYYSSGTWSEWFKLNAGYADSAGSTSNLIVQQYLSNSDTNWYPLIWGGDDHRNTYTSTGGVYKSHDVLSWQTSSQTLYATNIQTNNIKNLSVGGGIYWNPYVESTTDGSDAASITLVKSGVAGGTTLVLSQMNDANDTIQFQTNGSARLYHNSYPILTTQNTYTSNGKGYINGTEITQVNNADKVDNRHAISTTPNTGIIYKAAIYTSSSLTSYWVRLASIPSISQNGEFVATIHVQSGHSNPGRSAILLVYLRGNASSFMSKSFKIYCNSNYDPNRFRLYYKDSDKTSEIWYQTTGQWDGIITTVISQSSEGSLYEGLTLYSGSITAVQTPSVSTYLSAQVSTITDNILGNAATATKLQTARSLWGQSFDGTADISGSIHIVSTGGSWNEGIRMHIASNSWCGLVMCGSDNTGTSGTSAKTWSIHNNDGKFYIAQNGSNSFTNGISCVNGTWAILSSGNVGIGTTVPIQKLHVNGSVFLGKTDLDNTPFTDSLQILANSGNESYNENFNESNQSFGITFIRDWKTGGYRTKQGGIYSVGSGNWRAGLAFRVKNNTTENGTHDITAMWISPAGNVGIGTTSPSMKLHVNGDGIYLNSTATCGINMYSSHGESSISYKSNGGIRTVLGTYANTSRTFLWNESIGEHVSILSSNGYFGIGTTNPYYKLDVNGDIWCRGALRVGSSATNNYIAFYGNTGDAPGSFATSFIGEHLWGGDESTELLLMKFNDVGNGIDGTTVSGPGPDRIRHIAHAHVFQIMTDTSQGDFATMAATTAVETKLDITRNRITASVPLYLQSDLHVNGILQFHVREAHIGHDSGYSDPWGGLDANFKFGGVLAATHIYSNGGFHKYGGNENQLLRADGGVAAFNWAGQSGQPTWLWGGNDFNSYYVYNPSNFRVAYASSAGNADTLDGYHATDGRTFNGNINWSNNWNDTWSDGTHTHPWYGFDHRYPNTGAYSTTITDYYGMTIKTANTLRLDFGTLLLNSGNVGIGTTSPTYKLDVNGSAHIGGTLIINSILNFLEVGAIRVANKTIINIGSDGVDFQKGVSFNDTASFLKSINIRTGLTEYNAKEYSTSNHSVIIGECLNNTTFIFKPASDGQLLFMKLGKKYSNIKIQCTARDCIVVKADNFNILIDRNTTQNIYGDGVSRFFIYEAIPNRWIEFRCG